MLGLALFFSTMLIIPVTQDKWAYRTFTGFGLSSMHLSTGIFTMEVRVRCAKNFIEDFVCQVGAKANGRHTLQQAVGVMCAISDTACDEMNRIYLASYIILFGTFGTIICLCCGAFLLYYYWFHQPLTKYRTMGMSMLLTSPFLGIVSCVFWTVVSPDLAAFPQAWTRAAAFTGTGILFAIKSMDMVPYGWCYFMYTLTLLLLIMTIAFLPCVVGRHPSEDEWEDWNEQHWEAMEDQLFEAQMGPGYGTTAPDQGQQHW